MSDNESKSNDSDQPISLAEHLSTVLDDEAGSFEQRRVLDELTSDDSSSGSSERSLCEKLSHYALIGESMRSTNPAAVVGPNFLASIHAKIAQEDEYHDVQLQASKNAAVNDDSSQKPSWFKSASGFALTASFAAVAFMGVQNYQLSNQLAEKTATIIAATNVSSEAPKIEKSMQAGIQTTALPVAEVALVKNKVAEDQQKYRQANAHARSFLKRYVDSHVQYASTSTFVPSVRVIAYADY